MSQQTRRYYPTDLSDEPWLKLEPLLPRPGSGTCRGNWVHGQAFTVVFGRGANRECGSNDESTRGVSRAAGPLWASVGGRVVSVGYVKCEPIRRMRKKALARSCAG